MVYPLAPSHLEQEYNKHIPHNHRPPASACVSTQLPPATSSSVRVVNMIPTSAYLLSLAFPSLLPLMWPAIPKRRFPRLHHPCTHWVLQMHITHSRLNTRRNCPSATGRQLQMLLKRVVALLPSAYRLSAKEALYIVGVLMGWEEEKSCGRQLWHVRNVTICWEVPHHTCSGPSHECGHFIDFGARPVALDPRRFGSGCAV